MSESDDEWGGQEPKKITRAEQLCLDGRASKRKVVDWIRTNPLSVRDACSSALDTGWPMSAPMARGRNLAPMAADSWGGKHVESLTSVDDFPTPPPAAVDAVRRFSFSEVGDNGQISDRTASCGDDICQPSPLGDVSGGGVWSRGQARDCTTAPLCSMSPPRDDSPPSTRCDAQAERLQSHGGDSFDLLQQPVSGASGNLCAAGEFSREPLALDDGRPGPAEAHAATHPPTTAPDGAFRRRSPMPTLSTSLDAHKSQSQETITTMTHMKPRNGRPAHLYNLFIKSSPASSSSSLPEDAIFSPEPPPTSKQEFPISRPPLAPKVPQSNVGIPERAQSDSGLTLEASDSVTAATVAPSNEEGQDRDTDVNTVGWTGGGGGDDAVSGTQDDAQGSDKAMRLLASGGELFGRGGVKDSSGRQGRMRRGGSRKGGGGHGKRRGSVVYEWAEGRGIDLIRRQGLMDKAGALARAMGRPGYGTQSLQAAKRAGTSKRLIVKTDITGKLAFEEEKSDVAAPAPTVMDWACALVSVIWGGKDSLHEGTTYAWIMIGATLLVLFGQDVKDLISFDPSSSPLVDTGMLAALILFTTDILCRLYFSPDYSMSPFFVLDFVSALAVLCQVLEGLFGVETIGTEAIKGLILLRTWRSAWAGSRSARINRLAWQRARMGETGECAELMVGKTTLDRISMRVIAIVCIMHLSNIVIRTETLGGMYAKGKPSLEREVGLSLALLTNLFQVSGGKLDSEPFRTALIDLVDSVEQQGKGVKCAPFTPPTGDLDDLGGNEWPVSPDVSPCSKIRYLRISNLTVIGSLPPDLEQHGQHRDNGLYHSWILTTSDSVARFGGRSEEEDEDQDHSWLVIDREESSTLVNAFNIVRVATIVLILAISGFFLGSDLDSLVISPLEAMARLVRDISNNPMTKVEHNDGIDHTTGETRLIVNALIKLSFMLQIGFGEAGASIVEKNLKLTMGEEVEPLVPGRRIMAIFGFCDVRNFTVATECLQEDTMVYVNCIAEYLHTAIHDNLGFPNKNIGDAWLMTWPLNDGAWTSTGPGMQKTVQEMAEAALRALLRVIVETSCSHVLSRFSCNGQLQKRVPGYRTEIGFGLHMGWAIEGAIGSHHKVDPSYLSPHVEFVQRLEGATKHYGVSVLMTDAFYDILPPKVQRLCRCIDRVKEKGNRIPTDIYTYDFCNFSLEGGSMPNITHRPERTFWEQFPPSSRSSFRKKFKVGLRHYFEGSWTSARITLEECLTARPGDRPTLQLLEVMAANGFRSPHTWKGYREISCDSFDILPFEDLMHEDDLFSVVAAGSPEDFSYEGESNASQMDGDSPVPSPITASHSNDGLLQRRRFSMI